MRTPSESAAGDVPDWSLWLVALVCFGPLAGVWLLGTLLLPVWVAMVAAQLGEPERFAHELSGSIWDAVWPIGFVVGGLIGLLGLVRVLTLPRHERPRSHRVFTIGMVAVGLTALMIFNVVDGLFSDFSEGVPVAAFAVYVVLPFIGAAWVLFKSRKGLFAGPRP